MGHTPDQKDTRSPLYGWPLWKVFLHTFLWFSVAVLALGVVLHLLASFIAWEWGPMFPDWQAIRVLVVILLVGAGMISLVLWDAAKEEEEE